MGFIVGQHLAISKYASFAEEIRGLIHDINHQQWDGGRKILQVGNQEESTTQQVTRVNRDFQ